MQKTSPTSCPVAADRRRYDCLAGKFIDALGFNCPGYRVSPAMAKFFGGEGTYIDAGELSSLLRKWDETNRLLKPAARLYVISKIRGFLGGSGTESGIKGLLADHEVAERKVTEATKLTSFDSTSGSAKGQFGHFNFQVKFSNGKISVLPMVRDHPQPDAEQTFTASQWNQEEALRAIGLLIRSDKLPNFVKAHDKWLNRDDLAILDRAQRIRSDSKLRKDLETFLGSVKDASSLDTIKFPDSLKLPRSEQGYCH